ncbi:hypothetical protein Ae201684P_004540 [Aphanomyces euteiches]|nr:hypothetical protein Ae201684P_004540 [Aphanomyces euteiches]
MRTILYPVASSTGPFVSECQHSPALKGNPSMVQFDFQVALESQVRCWRTIVERPVASVQYGSQSAKQEER